MLSYLPSLLRPLSAWAVTLLLGLMTLAGCSKPPPAAAPPSGASAVGSTQAASSNNISTNVIRERPRSVFLTNPVGRDPFFPESKRFAQLSNTNAGKSSASVNVASKLTLQAVAGSAARRIAIINNVLFEAGKEATVTIIADGKEVKAVVACRNITRDSAEVTIDGGAPIILKTTPKF